MNLLDLDLLSLSPNCLIHPVFCFLYSAVFSCLFLHSVFDPRSAFLRVILADPQDCSLAAIPTDRDATSHDVLLPDVHSPRPPLPWVLLGPAYPL